MTHSTHHTIDTHHVEHYVHVVPIGHDIDRVVEAFGPNHFLAHRVHLLVNSVHPGVEPGYSVEMFSHQQEYNREAVERLKMKGLSVQEHPVDLFNIIEVMKVASRLISREQRAGNRVYVNMSACGKLASLGVTLAAMANDAEVYFIKADEYAKTEDEQRCHGLSIVKDPHILHIENFVFALPDEVSRHVLGFVEEQDGEASIESILKDLCTRGVDGFSEKYWELDLPDRRKIQQKYLMKFNHHVVKKLEDARYIQRKRSGNNKMISLTKSGRYVAAVSGTEEKPGGLSR